MYPGCARAVCMPPLGQLKLVSKSSKLGPPFVLPFLVAAPGIGWHDDFTLSLCIYIFLGELVTARVNPL